MKITKQYLLRIIEEEIETTLATDIEDEPEPRPISKIHKARMKALVKHNQMKAKKEASAKEAKQQAEQLQAAKDLEDTAWDLDHERSKVHTYTNPLKPYPGQPIRATPPSVDLRWNLRFFSGSRVSQRKRINRQRRNRELIFKADADEKGKLHFFDPNSGQRVENWAISYNNKELIIREKVPGEPDSIYVFRKQ